MWTWGGTLSKQKLEENLLVRGKKHWMGSSREGETQVLCVSCLAFLPQANAWEKAQKRLIMYLCHTSLYDTNLKQFTECSTNTLSLSTLFSKFLCYSICLNQLISVFCRVSAVASCLTWGIAVEGWKTFSQSKLFVLFLYPLQVAS